MFRSVGAAVTVLRHARRRWVRSKSTTVAVAMSGGIDSSVAAMLLQQQGHRDLVGVFMTNWNSSDEEGRSVCTISRDRNDMREVCDRLGIPAVDVRSLLPRVTFVPDTSLSCHSWSLVRPTSLLRTGTTSFCRFWTRTRRAGRRPTRT